MMMMMMIMIMIMIMNLIKIINLIKTSTRRLKMGGIGNFLNPKFSWALWNVGGRENQSARGLRLQRCHHCHIGNVGIFLDVISSLSLFRNGPTLETVSAVFS